MKQSASATIELGESAIDVEFTSDITYHSGEFSYAGTHCTGGMPGTHSFGPEAEVDGDIRWDRTLYDKELNSYIESFVALNEDMVCERLLEEFWLAK